MPEKSAEEFVLEAKMKCNHGHYIHDCHPCAVEWMKARDAAIAAEARETAIDECIAVIQAKALGIGVEFLRALRATPARAIGQHEGSNDA